MSSSSSKPGPSCKRCGKPGYTGPDGKVQHEKRSDPAVYGGRRADPGAKKKPAQDEPPDRTHPLDKRLFGGTGRTE